MIRSLRRVAIGAAAILVTSCSPSMEHQIWAYRTPRPFFPGESEMYGPVLVGGRAIVCGGYGWDRDGRLASVDIANGRRQWAHVVGWCYAPPIVAGNVAVGWGHQSHSLTIKAVDIDTGKLRWECSLPERVKTWRRPLQHRGWVYLPGRANTVIRLDTATGSYREITIPGCPPEPSRNRGLWVAVDEGRAIAGCGDAIYALDSEATSPCLLTKLEEPVGRIEGAVLHGDVVYLSENTSRRGGVLSAFDLRTGRKVWERRWKKNVKGVGIVGGSLYAHVFEPKWEMIALDPVTGVERWRADVHGFHPPLLLDRHLYVDDQGPTLTSLFRLAVLDAATGKVLRRWRVPDEIEGTPVVAEDKIFVGTLAGVLYAIQLRRLI